MVLTVEEEDMLKEPFKVLIDLHARKHLLEDFHKHVDKHMEPRHKKIFNSLTKQQQNEAIQEYSTEVENQLTNVKANLADVIHEIWMQRKQNQ